MADLTERDKELIAEIHKRWIAAELSGHISEVIELSTDDVTWLPPQSSPLVGKEAIAQYLQQNEVDLKDIQISNLVINGNDTVAYLISNYSSRYVLAGTSETQEARGTHLWILRKARDGGWRVAVVTWSSW
jgi:uncharacterized protein (TIGR02246 family)